MNTITNMGGTPIISQCVKEVKRNAAEITAHAANAAAAAAHIRETWNATEINACLRIADAAADDCKKLLVDTLDNVDIAKALYKSMQPDAKAALDADMTDMDAAAETAINGKADATAAAGSAHWNATLSRYESAYSVRNASTESAFVAALMDAAKAIASSVINKTVDPQRKTAPDMVKKALASSDPNARKKAISNSGYNPAMVNLRREIWSDTAALDNLHAAAAAAFSGVVVPNKDGVEVYKRIAADATAAAMWKDMEMSTLGDGIDLVQAAAAALLQQSADHAGDAPGWMEAEYTALHIKRRVLIQVEDTAAWEEVVTAPIREAFRAVRRVVAASRAVTADPRCKYCYVEDMAATPDDSSTLEVVYYRLHKYADIGGYAHTGHFDMGGNDPHDGHYTVNAAALMDYNDALERLNLTDRQAEIVRLRMEGYGYDAISSFLGVKKTTVTSYLGRLREKCVSMGFIPSGDNAARIARDNALRTVVAMDAAAAAADMSGDSAKADNIYLAIAEDCDTHSISRHDIRRTRENIAREISAALREANAAHRAADAAAKDAHAAADQMEGDAAAAAHRAADAAAAHAHAAADKKEEEAYAAAETYGVTASMLNNIK